MNWNPIEPLPMEKVLNNNYSIPYIGFSTFGKDTRNHYKTSDIIKRVLGDYRYFDCSPTDGNEAVIGEALESRMRFLKLKREKIFVASKLPNNYHKKEMVTIACRKSLKALCVDYLDLYLIEWPFSEDPSDIDYLETWLGMEECMRLGLVRSIGVCNFSLEQMQRLYEYARIKPMVLQIEMHVRLNQKELREFCYERNIQVIAYGVFGNPKKRLFNMDKLPDVELDIGKIPEITEIAKKHGKSNWQVVLRYLMDLNVIPLVSTTDGEKLLENVNILGFELSNDEIAKLNQLNCNIRYYLNFLKKYDSNYPFKEDAVWDL